MYWKLSMIQLALPGLALMSWGGLSMGSAKESAVEGSFTRDGVTVTLTHAYAHLHDNAEGILDRNPELRILLSDREVSPEVLVGLGILPVDRMAVEGAIQGLLIALQPDTPNEINVTYLLQPEEEGMSTMNQYFSTSDQDLWASFEFSEEHLRGVLEKPDDGFSVSFSVPVAKEPAVSALLEGDEAKQSEPYQVLLTQLEAVKAGDLNGLRAMMTEASKTKTQEMIERMGATEEQMVGMLEQMAPEREAMLAAVQKVVIRGDRALVLFQEEEGSRSWSNLVKVDGVWKVDD